MTKKLIALALALLMVLAVFAGCAKEPAANTPDETEQPTQTPSQILDQQPVATPAPEGVEADPDATVVWNLGWGPENQMNPYLTPSFDYMRHMFCSPLVMFATTADGVESMEYILAEDVICNDDMTEFTIKLRPENKWHDGEPFTAHDVVYSATVLWYDDAFMYSMYYGREAQPGVWTEVDDYTVNVKYETPYKDFLHFLDDNLVVAPAHIFEGITGEDLKDGDVLIGMASSGVHSNGFSLVRKIFAMTKESLDTYYDELGMTLGEALLAPTRIYVKALKAVKDAGVRVKACSHITGGGFYENIPRMLPEGKRAVVQKDSYEVPAIFRLMADKGNVSEQMMYNTYNMGLGMIVAVAPEDVKTAMEAMRSAGDVPYVVGKIIDGEKGVDLC